MNGKASRAVTDMDPAKKIHLREELARKFNRANGSKVGCFNSGNRKIRRENMKTLDGPGVAHTPRVLQPTLMGVQIYDDSQHFFSRQSSTASMVSEKSRSGVAVPCFSRNEHGDALKAKRGLSIVSSSDAGKRTLSGRRLGDSSRNRLDGLSKKTSFEEARAASGVLYPPSPRTGGNANSSILNAVHFSFGDASTAESGLVTDKIYKQLLDQARSQKGTHGGGVEMKRSSSRTTHRSSSSVAKQSPRSTLVRSSASLTFSERLFGYEFARESFRRLSEQQQQQQPDARNAQASLNRTTLIPQLHSDRQANNSVSILPVSDYEDTDDDDIIIEGDVIFEIPSETPFRCSHGKQHYAELVMVRTKPRPPSERWSTNKKSFHLNLKRHPSINGSNRRQHRSATPADPESRDVAAREELDVSHQDISARPSSDGGSKRGTQLSSFASGRSGWIELEADMDDFVLDSGRLKIDVPFEPDLDKPFIKQANNRFQSRNEPKVDEGYFPFNSPIASSFLFDEPGGKKRSEDAAAQSAVLNTNIAAMAKAVYVEMECDDEELDVSEDVFHDPEEGSISDTDSSLTTFSLEEAESIQGHMDLQQHTQWISTTSFNYLREVVDHNSGFVNIESRSGRFSVDLRQEKRLKKVEHPHSINRPGVRVSLRRSSQSKPSSSRRSILAPCLVCLSCIHQRPAQAEQP